MGRRFTRRWCLLCFCVTAALQPAHGGDRKPAAARHTAEASGGIDQAVAAFTSAGSDPVTWRNSAEAPSLFALSDPEAKASSRVSKASARHDEHDERERTPPTERKTPTLFRVDPKFGDIAVEPVIGAAKGLQLSVGF